jgi:hypothetical protein
MTIIAIVVMQSGVNNMHNDCRFDIAAQHYFGEVEK